MLSALSKAGFHTRTRWSEKARQAVTIWRLEQIFLLAHSKFNYVKGSPPIFYRSDATFATSNASYSPCRYY